MNTDLTAGIVRILKPDGTTAGTGFVLTDEGLIATCGHVVEASSGGLEQPVWLAFQAGGAPVQAEISPDGYHPEADVAFLKLSGSLPPGVRSVTLGASGRRAETRVGAFGYPELGQIEGLWGKGTLVGPVKEAEQPLIQLSSKEITKGFSGGPVWDIATGHVIGMVTSVAVPDHLARLSDVAFAIPSETLRHLCPAELPELAQHISETQRIREKILKCLYDTRHEYPEGLTEDELIDSIGLPPKVVQSELSTLHQKDYIEVHELRLAPGNRFVSITIAGIDVVETGQWSPDREIHETHFHGTVKGVVHTGDGDIHIDSIDFRNAASKGGEDDAGD